MAAACAEFDLAQDSAFPLTISWSSYHTQGSLVTADIAIERIIQPGILHCAPDTPLHEAAQRMVQARCSSIAVMEAEAIVGLWTEHDALALDISDPRLFLAPIAQHMSSPVKTLPAGTSLGETAMRFREEKVRHFLVVDAAGAYKGIVTQTDIVLNQGVEYYLSLREVQSVLNRRYPVIASTLPLPQAVQAMRARDADAAIVAYPDGDHGILTERDMLRLIGNGNHAVQVGEIASRPLVTVTATSSLYRARQIFVERQIRHLGVTAETGELQGLVTFADILASVEHDYVRQLRETLRERERSLEISQQHQRLALKVFESTLEGIIVTNRHGIIESVNPAFTRITGYGAGEVTGQRPSLLSSGRHDDKFYRHMWDELNAHGHWQGEIWNRRRNGEIYPEWLTINMVRNDAGEVLNYIGVFSDITKRKAVEQRMQFLAYHDGLTGLPNRGLFLDRLHHAVAHAHRSKEMVAVMFLDLDGFKPVNDTLGHHIGDQLLQVVAQRLLASVREADTVARLGGDEFTIVLESITDADDVPLIAGKIIAAVSEAIRIDDHAIGTTPSVGISVYPADATQPEELLRLADMAMYAAKKDGGGRFRFFTADMKEDAPRRSA